MRGSQELWTEGLPGGEERECDGDSGLARRNTAPASALRRGSAAQGLPLFPPRDDDLFRDASLPLFGASTPRDRAESSSSSPEKARGRPRKVLSFRTKNARHALLAEHAEVAIGIVDPGEGIGARKLGKSRSSADNFLNLCVSTRTLLARRWMAWTLVCVALGLVLASVVVLALNDWRWGRLSNVHIACYSFAAVALILVVRFHGLASAGRGYLRQFTQMVRGDRGKEDTRKYYSMWFRVNCGFDPLGIFVRQFVMLLSSVGLWVVGFREPFLLTACTVLCLWCMVIMGLCCCLQDQIWKPMLVQACFVSALSITCHWLLGGAGTDDWGSPLKTAALLAMTQAGMSRHSRSQLHVVSVLFFMIIFGLVAVVTFLTASDETGLMKTVPPLEFCSDPESTCPREHPPAGDSDGLDDWWNGDSKTCCQFEFPLNGAVAGYPNPARQPYDFCGLSWPMGTNTTTVEAQPGTVSSRCEDTRLTLVDFGHLARVAYYLPDYDKIHKSIEQYLPGWELQHSEMYSKKGGKHNTFVHLRRGSTDVVSVRGTFSMAEVFQDLNLWMPAVLLQLAGYVGPSIFSMRNILEQMTAGVNQYRQNIVGELYEYTRELTEQAIAGNVSRTVYLTGHSLGGGLAAAIGANLSLTAVTFSAPGLGATSALLNIAKSDKAQRHYITNVWPERDLVPRADIQAGMVLPIDCSMDPFSCHQLGHTVCELLAACGDGGGRGVPRGYARDCRICAQSGQSYDDHAAWCPNLPPQKSR